MATPSLYPLFLKAQAGGSVTNVIGQLDIEVHAMPDVEVQQPVDVEVSAPVDVDVVEPIDVEIS